MQLLGGHLVFFKKLLDDYNKSGTLSKVNASDIEGSLSAFIPLVKVNKEKYFFGTEAKNITLKAGKLMVRVGGGYDDFQLTLKMNAFMECIKIINSTQKTGNKLSDLTKAIMKKENSPTSKMQ